jgi:cell wall-associated NlpC family hydrolase
LAEIGNETSSEVSASNNSDAIHYGSRAERKKAERHSFAKSARATFTSSRRGRSRLALASTAVAVSRPSVEKNEAPRSAPRAANANRVALHRRSSGAVVMTVAVGIISTFALPAYAFNPAEGAVDHTTFVVPEATTQSLYVATSTEGSTARDAFSATAAAPVALNNGYGDAPFSPGVSVDVSGIASNSALLSAALSLVGMPGDCTMLIESALRLLGYQVGDLAPMGFGGYGTTFYDPSQVQPGDIMMRAGHVSIYAGPGLAVQGGIGYMSYLTSVASNPAEYAAFVRVG